MTIWPPRWMAMVVFGLVWTSGTTIGFGQDAAPDIQILDAKWGFDGHVRHKTFVPLRIVIKNRGTQNLTLPLRLSRADALNAVGESLEQEILIAAETTRVVQMVPFVSDPGETWTLRWGPADEDSYTIKSNSADDGIVLITSRSDLSSPSGFLHTMPEDEFPTSVTALDSLRYQFLDREPRWPAPRRKALEEWLIKGGVVIILNQNDGTRPEFTELPFLNTQGKLNRYGQGLIVRLERTPNSISKSFLEKEILGRPLTGGDLDQRLKAYEKSSVRYAWWDPSAPMQVYSRDKVLTQLMDVAGARQRWGWIYLAAVAYIVWQWRVGWRWGLMEKKPERHYAWVVGLAIGFSLLFYFSSNAGALNSDRMRSLLVARRIGSGICDVEGWGVIGTGLTGDFKTIEAPGSGQLYGGAESFGQNPISIRNQQMVIDLPAFASQRVAFRSRMEIPDIPFQLLAAGPDMWQTKSARIQIDPSFSGEVYAAVVAIEDRLYEFERKSGELVPTKVWTETTLSWLNPYHPRRSNWRFSLLGKLFDWRTEDEIYREAFLEVVGNGFNVGSTVYPDSFRIPPGTARVMLFTDWPESAAMKGNVSDQGGRMLYVQDVPIGAP